MEQAAQRIGQGVHRRDRGVGKGDLVRCVGRHEELTAEVPNTLGHRSVQGVGGAIGNLVD